ncbi:MAG: NADH-ubiquinone oxidoreductase-F iron-sulfur binding region domain-containing protein [Patescibacteria group bacterium]|nr:NADH-ubiquinone oxidoreductase-F iron-sulfur binding region domain-containing protein [Patescibacteria group bacterium]
MQETKIITKLCGKIDPFSIESYISRGGYQQLLAYLKNIKTKKGRLQAHKKIMKLVEESGLCGRGGAGFPTGEKWRIAYQKAQKSRQPLYLIVNGDESQPGAFKDSFLMKKNPHLIIEGIIILAYVLECKKVFVYINGTFKEELEIMRQAVTAAFEHKFLGGKTTDFKERIKIKIIQGAGGYIYGEETALIDSLEGNRGEPKIKPPFPPQSGYNNSPTVVNNIETIANLVPLLEMGAKKYRQLGKGNATGTKLFSVSGAVKNPGVFEFPLGTSLRAIIYGICGGMEKGKKLAFVQVGGTGDFLVGKQLDYCLTYEKGKQKIPVGLGNILVVDKNVAVEDLMFSWSQFYARESCGQCTPCREGTYQLLKIAERLKEKKLMEKDYENMQDIVEVLEKTSLCPFGNFAAQPWKKVIKFYGADFFDARKRKK